MGGLKIEGPLYIESLLSRLSIVGYPRKDTLPFVHGFTVKPVLRDHCHETTPVLTDHTFLAEGPTFQYN